MRPSERRNPFQAIVDELVGTFCFGDNRLIHCDVAQKGTENSQEVVLFALLGRI